MSIVKLSLKSNIFNVATCVRSFVEITDVRSNRLCYTCRRGHPDYQVRLSMRHPVYPGCWSIPNGGNYWSCNKYILHFAANTQNCITFYMVGDEEYSRIYKTCITKIASALDSVTDRS